MFEMIEYFSLFKKKSVKTYAIRFYAYQFHRFSQIKVDKVSILKLELNYFFRFFDKNCGFNLRFVFSIGFLFFFLEKKEPKIQDLETLAKILNNFLKSPKLGRIVWFEFLT